jgi:hypothetical protein
MYLSKSRKLSSIIFKHKISTSITIIANNHKNNIVQFDLNYKEKYYQKIVEDILQGKHKTLQSGITDVTNNDTHAEIKHWTKWKFLLGQLLSYNNCDYKPNLHAYMFGHYPEKNKIIALEILKKYEIIPYEFIKQSDKLLLVNLITDANNIKRILEK